MSQAINCYSHGVFNQVTFYSTSYQVLTLTAIHIFSDLLERALSKDSLNKPQSPMRLTDPQDSNTEVGPPSQTAANKGYF